MTRRFLLVAALVGSAGLAVAAADLAGEIEHVSLRAGVEWLAIGGAVLVAWRATLLLARDAAVEHVGRVTALTSIAEGRRFSAADNRGLYPAWYLRMRVAEEMARARRYGRAFSVVRVMPAGSLDDAIGFVVGRARAVDLAGEIAGQIVMLLPDTSAEAALALVHDIREAGHAVHSASVPDDAATLDDLLGVGWLDDAFYQVG